MSAGELDALCEKARESYLDAEREFKKLTPVSPPGYGAAITPNTPDAKTVGELKAEYATQAKAYEEYQEVVYKSRNPFAWHLNLVSGGTVLRFDENTPSLEVELSWGHNHGVTVDYSPTQTGDYPFPEDEDDNDL